MRTIALLLLGTILATAAEPQVVSKPDTAKTPYLLSTDNDQQKKALLEYQLPELKRETDPFGAPFKGSITDALPKGEEEISANVPEKADKYQLAQKAANSLEITTIAPKEGWIVASNEELAIGDTLNLTVETQKITLTLAVVEENRVVWKTDEGRSITIKNPEASEVFASEEKSETGVFQKERKYKK